MVKSFYRLHLSREDILNKKEVSLRGKYFTPKLRQLFDAEIKRQTSYSKKNPADKPYFDGFSFQPIEFCQEDYEVEKARIKRQTAIVKVNFIYGKSSCQAKDGTSLSYKILLSKLGGKWLINDVIYDDGTTLIKAFSEAKKVN